MAKPGNIVRYTSEALAAMRARGESQTDWKRAAAIKQEELQASIAADPDQAAMVVDWSTATIEVPQPKAVLNMRVDPDMLAFFKRTGKGYQTRINAVLRAFVDAQQRRAG